VLPEAEKKVGEYFVRNQQDGRRVKGKSEWGGVNIIKVLHIHV
jgi:hypothetical protein